MWTVATLIDAKPRMPTVVFGIVSENNVLFGNPHVNEVIRHAAFSAVMLNPDLIILNINMDDTAVDAPVLL